LTELCDVVDVNESPFWGGHSVYDCKYDYELNVNNDCKTVW